MFFPIDLKVFCLISVTKTKIKKLFLYKENKKTLKKRMARIYYFWCPNIYITKYTVTTTMHYSTDLNSFG